MYNSLCRACCCLAILHHTFVHQAMYISLFRRFYYPPRLRCIGFRRTTNIFRFRAFFLLYNSLKIWNHQPRFLFLIHPGGRPSSSPRTLHHYYGCTYHNHWPYHLPIRLQIYLHLRAKIFLFRELCYLSILLHTEPHLSMFKYPYHPSYFPTIRHHK